MVVLSILSSPHCCVEKEQKHCTIHSLLHAFAWCTRFLMDIIFKVSLNAYWQLNKRSQRGIKEMEKIYRLSSFWGKKKATLLLIAIIPNEVFLSCICSMTGPFVHFSPLIIEVIHTSWFSCPERSFHMEIYKTTSLHFWTRLQYIQFLFYQDLKSAYFLLISFLQTAATYIFLV